jgi:hypothetical protein
MRDPARSTHRRWLPLVVFLAAFTVYAASPVCIQTDSIWTLPTAASLLHQGNADLDEFAPTFTSYTRSGVLTFNGHAYFAYPMGAVLAAVPFLVAADLGLRLASPLLPHLGKVGAYATRWLALFHATGDLDLGFYNQTEHLIASVLVALAAMLVFLAARRRTRLGPALAATAVFAFGTTAYSTASRVLWQHAPSLLAIAAVVYLAGRAEQTRRTAFLAGLAVAFSYVARPTNGLAVLAITALYLWRWRAKLVAYFAGAAVVAVPYLADMLATYGALFPPYYRQGLDFFSLRFLQALAANAVSPSRGLFVFSPVLLFAFWGMARALRRRERAPWEVAFAAVVVAQWLVVSAFPVWWAGHSVGPRFLTDVLPFLAYFLVEPLDRLTESPRAHPAALGAFALTAAISLAIHTSAATRPAVHHWNDGPPNVDQAPERAWSWADPQFLR